MMTQLGLFTHEIASTEPDQENFKTPVPDPDPHQMQFEIKQPSAPTRDMSLGNGWSEATPRPPAHIDDVSTPTIFIPDWNEPNYIDGGTGAITGRDVGQHMNFFVADLSKNQLYQKRMKRKEERVRKEAEDAAGATKDDKQDNKKN